MNAKQLTFIFSHGPFGSSLAAEGLDAVLAASVFDQKVNVVFQLDGVYLLLAEGHSEGIGMKDFRKGFKALQMYGVENLLVDQKCLNARGLSSASLIDSVTISTSDEIAQFLRSSDAVFTF